MIRVELNESGRWYLKALSVDDRDAYDDAVRLLKEFEATGHPRPTRCSTFPLDRTLHRSPIRVLMRVEHHTGTFVVYWVGHEDD